MANINVWLENLLLICSIVFATWNKHRNVNFYLVSSICLMFSMTEWYNITVWVKFSRNKLLASLWYGGLVVPLVLDCHTSIAELFSANVIFVVIFIFCNNTKNSIQYKYIALALFTYFVLYGSYISFVFNIMTYILFVCKVLLFIVTFFVCFILTTNSFSVGEALAVAQLITHFFINGLTPLLSSFDVITLATLIGYSTGLFALISITGMSMGKKLQHYKTLYCSIIFCLISLLVILEKGFLTIFHFSINFLCQNYPTRQILVSFWLILCLTCFGYVTKRPAEVKASTVERKKFHGYILLVYISGLLFDIPLLFISSVTVFCLFVILSTICAYQVKPLGPHLNQLMLSFTDKQDAGKFILTPVYLVFGLSFPIWLCYIDNVSLLGGVNHFLPFKCFSGILSVGIGDACASWFGSKYGRTKISGTPKTIEGALASILVQLFVVLLLAIMQIVETNFMIVIISTSIVALVEMVTTEIDNLVLPLLMYMLLA